MSENRQALKLFSWEEKISTQVYLPTYLTPNTFHKFVLRFVKSWDTQFQETELDLRNTVSAC